MISVVIPTVDRSDQLAATLAALRFQQGPQFEVVVVHGPADDGTAEVVAEHSDVTLVDCPVRNVSAARNAGIIASAGDLIVFLDDDAIPEFNWLRDLTAAFDDQNVGGAGGLVLDHTGTRFQTRYVAVDRFGAISARDGMPYEQYAYPGSLRLPCLVGCNAAFRRSALAEVGGYDEAYTYYHDDADVCVRLVDRGFAIRQLAGAVVHHHFAPSAIRNPAREITDVRPIVRSATYFTFRHGAGYADPELLAHTSDLVRNHFAALADNGTRHRPVAQIDADSHCAWREGRELAASPARTRHDLGPADPARFRAFATTVLEAPLIVLGADAATAVARCGAHSQLRCMIADGGDVVELVGSTWVHHLRPGTAALANELDRIAEWVDDARVVCASSAIQVEAVAAMATSVDTVHSGTSAREWDVVARLRPKTRPISTSK